ncbi:hypothetical protein ABZ825_17740 [Streptomyces tauricus]|uniref:hypothetical protein n=1 Tax=Streptomyces tauricus TaxID=68274 RepID=UPI003402591F
MSGSGSPLKALKYFSMARSRCRSFSEASPSWAMSARWATSSAERVCSTAAGSASGVGKCRQSVPVSTPAFSATLSKEAPIPSLMK